MGRISAVLGAPLGTLGGAGVSGGLLDLKADALGEAASKMAEQLDDPKTVESVKLLLTGLRKGDQPIEFDLEFSGNYGVLVKLIAWCLKENFGSFFADSAGLAALKDKVVQSVQASSTGGSGA